jgi:hypothetical protein
MFILGKVSRLLLKLCFSNNIYSEARDRACQLQTQKRRRDTGCFMTQSLWNTVKCNVEHYMNTLEAIDGQLKP